MRHAYENGQEIVHLNMVIWRNVVVEIKRGQQRKSILNVFRIKRSCKPGQDVVMYAQQ